jgi:hypothetical protein
MLLLFFSYTKLDTVTFLHKFHFVKLFPSCPLSSLLRITLNALFHWQKLKNNCFLILKRIKNWFFFKKSGQIFHFFFLATISNLAANLQLWRTNPKRAFLKMNGRNYRYFEWIKFFVIFFCKKDTTSFGKKSIGQVSFTYTHNCNVI